MSVGIYCLLRYESGNYFSLGIALVNLLHNGIILHNFRPSAESEWCQGGATYWHLYKLNALKLP
jgi:hypothetical protein